MPAASHVYKNVNVYLKCDSGRSRTNFLSTNFFYLYIFKSSGFCIVFYIFIIQNHTIMADTFTQIYIQVVFAVQNRNALIHKSWEEEMYKYITGIVQKKGQKMLAINGTSNHIHFFIGMKPTCCLSDLVREVKKSSNAMVKEKQLTPFNFNWQEGFGAFSYSHSQLGDVIRYIETQKEHHKKKTFKEEYLAFLKAFEIEFKDEYLFQWLDD